MAFASNSTIPPWTIIALQRALVDLLAGRPAAGATPEAAVLAPLDANARAALAGRYRVPGVGTLELREGGPAMRVQVDGGLEYDAFPVARNALYVPGVDWLLGFSRDGEGAPTRWRVHLRGMYHAADALRAPD